MYSYVLLTFIFLLRLEIYEIIAASLFLPMHFVIEWKLYISLTNIQKDSELLNKGSTFAVIFIRHFENFFKEDK